MDISIGRRQEAGIGRDEIIFIDRYKQAAADIDSRPVGSHISEASFETSLEAIKRRTHFLRSCCHLVVAGHPR